MDARIRELLKPEILNTVNGLELVARIIYGRLHQRQQQKPDSGRRTGV